jgi:hypothetical protein
MLLFNTDRTRVAIFWDQRADAAQELKAILTSNFDSFAEFRVNIEIAAIHPSYSEQSKVAIAEADGILLLVRDEDYRPYGDFARELATIELDVKSGKRPPSFFRFVAIGDDRLPHYHTPGLHPIRLQSVVNLTEAEKTEIGEWLGEIRRHRGGNRDFEMPRFDFDKISSDSTTRVAILRWLTKFERPNATLVTPVEGGLADSVIRNDLALLKELHSAHSTCGNALEEIADSLYVELAPSRSRKRSFEDLEACVSAAIDSGIRNTCGNRAVFYGHLTQLVDRGVLPVIDNLARRLPSGAEFFDFARRGLSSCVGRAAAAAGGRTDIRKALRERVALLKTINQGEALFFNNDAQALFRQQPQTSFLAKSVTEAKMFLNSVIECAEFIALLHLVDRNISGNERDDVWGSVAGLLRDSAGFVRSNGAVYSLVQSSNNLILLYITALSGDSHVKAA